MCYDAQYLTKRAEKYADRYGIPISEMDELIRRLGPTYHSSGFAHPDLAVLNAPRELEAMNWGLVPFWVKDWSGAQQIRNKTLNARGESMFDSNSYRKASRKRRCIVIMDAFYEHHHLAKKTFPYRISFKNDEPISMAGIWEEWNGEVDGKEVSHRSFSIVTTKGNDLMAKIHNNPKMEGARMPLILPPELENEWMEDREEDELDLIKDLIKPYPSDAFEAHSVRRIRGKNAVGNKKEVTEPYPYPELAEEQSGTLFD